MDTYIEKNKIIGMIKATPLVEGHEEACRMTLKMACEVLEGELDTALTQTAEKARVEGEERFGKILSEIESSLKTSNGGKEEIEGIIWIAHEALSASPTKN